MFIFNEDLASAIGINEAIVVGRIHYWQGTNSGKVIDGERWIFNTLEQWHKQFKWMTMYKVRECIKNLELLGILKSEKKNTNKSVQTKWYALNYDSIFLVNTEYEHPALGRDTKGTDALKCINTKKPGADNNVFAENQQTICGKPADQLLETTEVIAENHQLYNTIQDTRKYSNTIQTKTRNVNKEFDLLLDFQKEEALEFIEKCKIRASNKNGIFNPVGWLIEMKRKVLDGEAMLPDNIKIPFRLTTLEEVERMSESLGVVKEE